MKCDICGSKRAKKLISYLLYFALVLVLISTSTAQKQLTVEDIYGSNKFWGKTLEGIQWTPDGKKFTYLQQDDQSGRLSIWSYDLKSGQREIFIDSQKVDVLEKSRREKRFNLPNYLWSPTGKDILFPTRKDLFIYNLKSGNLKQLTADELEERDPQFSPDGRYIAYLKNHNIYVLDIETGIETQLTFEENEHILVGQFDWVYEEEFQIRTGFFWAPDGNHIAYFHLDETQVPDFPIVDFIPIHNQVQMMKYPKAGDKNSIVKIGVVAIENPQTIWMDLGQETDIYIPRIKWLPNSQTLAIYRLNRDQNQLELLFGDITTGQTRTILVEHEKQGWLDITDDLTFLKDGKGFIWSSDQDGFRHLYLYDLSGHLIRQLTRGHWEVENIVRVDEENSVVYFTATEKSPLERHLYRVNLDGQGFKRLSTREGTHHINMAPNCKYYLDSFSNVTTPTQVSLHTSDGRMKELIEPNEIEALKDYQLSPPEFLTLKTEDDAVLNAYLIKPVNFDPEKKYPVLIYTYGGPGSQIVRNHWPLDRYFWHQMLTQKGYLIFALDNRGTGGRGKMFMKQVYRRLGEYEVKDQINGVKFLRSLPYVDGNRIGIWGWSYGGYTTCMCMLKGAEYFKLGIAVAPVTDWKNYDTIYTERYMDQPGDNSEGYEESSTLIHAEKLKGKLLLVHGDADDNVHLSNTLQLAQALQQADRPFDLMVYPRKMHGIRGAQVHLFKMLTDYILQNL